jgi:hypothetical protein
MSYTRTDNVSETFTETHARYLATKVATDLKRLQRFYGFPSDDQIRNYETELSILLKNHYVLTVAYGFRRAGNWIEPTLKYEAKNLQQSDPLNDDPGRIRPGANVDGATFYSYLVYTDRWFALSDAERAQINATLPFVRPGAAEPGVVGYLAVDRTYSAGGRELQRASVRST